MNSTTNKKNHKLFIKLTAAALLVVGLGGTVESMHSVINPSEAQTVLAARRHKRSRRRRVVRRRRRVARKRRVTRKRVTKKRVRRNKYDMSRFNIGGIKFYPKNRQKLVTVWDPSYHKLYVYNPRTRKITNYEQDSTAYPATSFEALIGEVTVDGTKYYVVPNSTPYMIKDEDSDAVLIKASDAEKMAIPNPNTHVISYKNKSVQLQTYRVYDNGNAEKAIVAGYDKKCNPELNIVDLDYSTIANDGNEYEAILVGEENDATTLFAKKSDLRKYTNNHPTKKNAWAYIRNGLVNDYGIKHGMASVEGYSWKAKNLKYQPIDMAIVY